MSASGSKRSHDGDDQGRQHQHRRTDSYSGGGGGRSSSNYDNDRRHSSGGAGSPYRNRGGNNRHDNRPRQSYGSGGGGDSNSSQQDQKDRKRVKPVGEPDRLADGKLNPKASPHVEQVFLNKNAGYESKTDIAFERVLHETAPEGAYRRRKDEEKTVIHWGQRKLLLSEIEFLSLYGDQAKVVVYAGAAPGTHIKALANMFPDHKFVLVDPANFTVKNSSNILCRQEMFTDAVAAEFTGIDTLFVSDIRSVDWSEHGEDETDQKVRGDQDAQMTWHQIMKPKASMLKFRLPWGDGSTEYLDGEIYLPVFGPITTTETRLIVKDGAGTKSYSNKKYEDQLFHFNTVTRVAVYEHEIDDDDEGLDHCYDCTAEIHILGDYLEKVRGEPRDPAEIKALSHKLSAECARNRVLLSVNSDPEERKFGIRARQWIDGKPAYDQSEPTKQDSWMDREVGKKRMYDQFVREGATVATEDSKRSRGFEDMSGLGYSSSFQDRTQSFLGSKGNADDDNDASEPTEEAASESAKETTNAVPSEEGVQTTATSSAEEASALPPAETDVKK